MTCRESDFCFAPYGTGFGNRLPHSVLGGCIPVIVQVTACPIVSWADASQSNNRVQVIACPILSLSDASQS